MLLAKDTRKDYAIDTTDGQLKKIKIDYYNMYTIEKKIQMEDYAKGLIGGKKKIQNDY